MPSGNSGSTYIGGGGRSSTEGKKSALDGKVVCFDENATDPVEVLPTSGINFDAVAVSLMGDTQAVVQLGIADGAAFGGNSTELIPFNGQFGASFAQDAVSSITVWPTGSVDALSANACLDPSELPFTAPDPDCKLQVVVSFVEA